MEYSEKDFLETGDPANRELSVSCRELTREYYLCDYRNEKKKREILKKTSRQNRQKCRSGCSLLLRPRQEHLYR